MAVKKHVEKALSGEKDLSHLNLESTSLLKGADLKGAIFKGTDLQHANLTGADLKGADLKGAKLYGANFKDSILQKADFRGTQNIEVNLRGADLTGAKFIDGYIEAFADSKTKFVDCDIRGNAAVVISSRSKNARVDFSGSLFAGGEIYDLVYNRCNLSRCDFRGCKIGDGNDFSGSDLSHSDFRGYKYLTEDPSWLEGTNLEGVKGLPASYTLKVSHEGETVEERLHREEEERLRREEEERLRREEKEARRKTIQDITRRVSRAKKDKELEALAQEVGSLQAQPEYVHEYENVLNGLQAKIEEKYSVVGKGIRYLKKLFSRGKRASQIRVASQMNRELQREIKALKRDLNK